MRLNATPNFKALYINPTGLEKIKKQQSNEFIENEIMPVAKLADKSPNWSLHIEDDGLIYVEGPNYQKSTLTLNDYIRRKNNIVKLKTMAANEQQKVNSHIVFETNAEAKKFVQKLGDAFYYDTYSKGRLRANLEIFKTLFKSNTNEHKTNLSVPLTIDESNTIINI
jgi:hypothetical protein